MKSPRALIHLGTNDHWGFTARRVEAGMRLLNIASQLRGALKNEQV